MSIRESAPLSLWGRAVRVETSDPADAALARRVVAGCVTAVRNAADPLRARSAPQRLAAAGGRPVAVDELFGDLLIAALDAARVSDGMVDPTVGNAVLRWAARDRADGACVNRPAVAHPHQLVLPTCGGGTATAVAARAAGWRRVEHVGPRVTVPGGTLLDVRAVAEPFLAIAASAYAARRTGGGVLVTVGGDAAHRGPVPVGGWRVRTAASTADGAPRDGEVLRLGEGWALSGVRPERIVDPSTGDRVAPVWRHVAVLGRGAVGARAMAMSAHVLGEQAPDWLAERGVAARLERFDGTVRRLAGWPVGVTAPRRASGLEHLASAS